MPSVESLRDDVRPELFKVFSQIRLLLLHSRLAGNAWSDVTNVLQMLKRSVGGEHSSRAFIADRRFLRLADAAVEARSGQQQKEG